MTRLIASPGNDPARFGLFSVATILDDPDIAGTGAEWESYVCGTPSEPIAAVCDPSGPSPDPQGGPPVVTAPPFVVVGSYECSALSRPMDDAYMIARQRLAFTEERSAEIIAAQLVAAAGPTDLTPTGGPTSVLDGVGLLESYLASASGTVGTIHAPRYASPALTTAAGVERHGQRLETVVGTLVAAGGGYDLVQYDDIADDGVARLFATGRVHIWRSGVTVAPDDDQLPSRSTNDVVVTAARSYVIGWDCPPAIVSVQVR